MTKKKQTQAEKFIQTNFADVDLPPTGNLVARMAFLEKENSRLSKALIGQQVSTELILDRVREVWDGHAPMKISAAPTTDKRKLDELVAVLVLSDAQIGKATATYNAAVAHKRITELFADKATQLIKVQRAGFVINDLRIYIIGDMVEGETIFPHQPHEIEMSLFKQAVEAAPKIMSTLIAKMLAIVPKVTVVTVPGNHGRSGSKYSGASPETNWDNVSYHVTKLMLESSLTPQERARLNFRISENFYAIDYVWEWGNFLLHGDTIRGGFAGIPFYGVSRKLHGYIDSIPEPFDYMHIGHFHQSASGVQNYHQWFINGTTESGNTYAQAQLAAAGYPCQRMFFMHKDHGMHSEHLVWLTDERVPTIAKMRRSVAEFDRRNKTTLPPFENETAFKSR